MTLMPLLTGIDGRILKELRTSRPRTLVLGSAQNVMSLVDASVNDEVLLTSTGARDIVGGTGGVIARVRSREITMHRHYQRSNAMREEQEAAVAQVQLEGCGTGRIIEITKRFRNLGIEAEVDRLPERFTAF
ncbi:MAG: hypothetical protein MAG715_01323 [Methanonatronarchaeales archaeon]|nr:hypothetical protein [Methanonatronarchaeales archaeon]